MSSHNYQLPVSNLFQIGMPKTVQNGEWVDYVELYGLTDEHTENLIHLASAKDLDWGDEYEAFAPVHAYRALGQLKATLAVPALVGLLNEIDDNDWFLEDLPEVFGKIGSTSLPPLKTYLAKRQNSLWGRVAASRGILTVAKFDPSQRQKCLDILTESLSNHKKQPPELNGSLVSSLIDLEAKEAISTIEKAYQEGPMDECVCGSLARVKIELDLAIESDFTPEELVHEQPAWMKSIKEFSESLSVLENQSAGRLNSSRDLENLEKRLSKNKKVKSTKPKTGFGFQPQKNNKGRKRDK